MLQIPKIKRISYIFPMVVSAFLLILLISGSLEFPSLSSPLPLSLSSPNPNFLTALDSIGSRPKEPFTDLLPAFSQWDSQIGCSKFIQKFQNWTVDESALQKGVGSEGQDCATWQGRRERRHVGVLVKGWTWIPDNLDGVYQCACGLSCVWSKSMVVVDRPDALLFENSLPPPVRSVGDPLRVYLDLEASRKPTGKEDIFIGYHANDDVQVTYAGKSFHVSRNYHISPQKRNDILVYWSSSRCLPSRNKLAKHFLSLIPHHSFGKCLNNMGGPDKSLSLYPHCSRNPNSHLPHWSDHLHCAMSHYKFTLAIENTYTQSYVTEKLFYALEAGSVPIYFGAPNVWDFVPPNSIIDGSRFGTVEELVRFVRRVADDPVAYVEFHAWRRCGVLGGFGRVRETSLDTLPCRLCEMVSRKGGRNASAS